MYNWYNTVRYLLFTLKHVLVYNLSNQIVHNNRQTIQEINLLSNLHILVKNLPLHPAPPPPTFRDALPPPPSFWITYGGSIIGSINFIDRPKCL